MLYFLYCNIVNLFKRNSETFIIVVVLVVSTAPVRILLRQHPNDFKRTIFILIICMEINLILVDNLMCNKLECQFFAMRNLEMVGVFTQNELGS